MTDVASSVIAHELGHNFGLGHSSERQCELGAETGTCRDVILTPAHPYTALLIEAIPHPDPDVRPSMSVPIGEPPSPISPAGSCGRSHS